ncbi:MAG TPA: TRAP transporter small permease [Burkholderiaceae bacterium]|jgi:C4-dicarboxylate transporter DctQ subunit|nr:TRAP transporter small permease [Burkholderiaceae bacterium]
MLALRLLDRLEETLIGTLMAVATVVIFASVVLRFFSTVPVVQDVAIRLNMTWAQELCIFLFVWMAKFGAAYGVRAGVHVGVDVLTNRLAPRPRKVLVTIGLLGGVLFTGVVGTLGAILVWEIAQTDQTSEDMEVPMWIVYLCVPLGSYLMCFRFVQVVVSFVRTGRVPHRHSAGLPSEAPGAPAPGAKEGASADERPA